MPNDSLVNGVSNSDSVSLTNLRRRLRTEQANANQFSFVDNFLEFNSIAVAFPDVAPNIPTSESAPSAEEKRYGSKEEPVADQKDSESIPYIALAQLSGLAAQNNQPAEQTVSSEISFHANTANESGVANETDKTLHGERNESSGDLSQSNSSINSLSIDTTPTTQDPDIPSHSDSIPSVSESGLAKSTEPTDANSRNSRKEKAQQPTNAIQKEKPAESQVLPTNSDALGPSPGEKRTNRSTEVSNEDAIRRSSALNAYATQSGQDSEAPRSRRAERLVKQANGTDTDPNAQENEGLENVGSASNAFDLPGSDATTSTNSPAASNLSQSSDPLVANSSITGDFQDLPGANNITLSRSNASLSEGAIKSSVSAVGQSRTTTQPIFQLASNSAIPSNANQPASSSPTSNPSVRSGNAGSISPYQEVKLVQRVLRGLEQLGNGGGQVKLRLHPPELGSLQLTLRMEGGQMFARMEVQNTVARDALLNNVQTLRDRLAEQGMKIESFEVQVSTEAGGTDSNGGGLSQNSGFGADSQRDNSPSRYAQINKNKLSLDSSVADRSPVAGWIRTNGSLDLNA